jgi:hypothetical protein
MEPNTEEGYPVGADETFAPNVVLFTPAGSCIVIPDIKGFIKSNGAEAVLVDEDDHLHFLRKGLKKNTLTWVCVTDQD